MTDTPDDQPTPPDPASEQPGYWPPQDQPTAAYGAPYPPQPPGYPMQGPMQGAVQYAPDHPRAVTVLVLGILGIVLCQVLAPFAWWVGKRTVDEIDASGGRLGGRTAAQAGYVMGIVGTVLLAVGLVFLILYFVVFAAALGGGMATTYGG